MTFAHNYAISNRNECIKNNISGNSNFYECEVTVKDLVRTGNLKKDYKSTNNCSVFDPSNDSCIDNYSLMIKINKETKAKKVGKFWAFH